MRILFLDPSPWNYDTTTPLKQPLGGTQSAIIYLSKELARLGHEITIINGVPQATEMDGIRFQPLPLMMNDMNSYDVAVTIGKGMGALLRENGCTIPIILWASHAVDQPAVVNLRNPVERNAHNGFAMVSEWQAKQYRDTFGIKASAQGIMRNAIAPSFLECPLQPRWFETGKPPVLGYSSTPYRGLDILLLAFPLIRKQIPGTTLRVFSSMGIYASDVSDPFDSLYELARNLPGVEYTQGLPQAELAKAISEIDVWAYPCTFAETSCISAMEAMASGLTLISTPLGALPETTAGLAHLADIESGGIPGLSATIFAEHVVKAVRAVEADPQAAQKAQAQATYARIQYNWRTRAPEWISWFERILGKEAYHEPQSNIAASG